ncbi:MAG: molybdate ABC transporter substrate-binding protein [Pyrinomonadaceae bacterium]
MLLRTMFRAHKFSSTAKSCVAVAAILFLLVVNACSTRNERHTQTPPDEIIVAAAANLTDAFASLGESWTKKTGMRVRFSFGATADLAKQIENGAPFDVFAAADVEHVAELERKNLLTQGTQKLYARGRLVLWVPLNEHHQPAPIRRIEDLKRADAARIAVAKPDVAPYGRAAVEALRALNVWTLVEPKVVYGQSVTQAKQYAATGNADAAFVPLALVRQEPAERIIAVDERLHQPIDQALGIVRASGKQAAARSFADFVTSEEGQSILRSFGYNQLPQGN